MFKDKKREQKRVDDLSEMKKLYDSAMESCKFRGHPQMVCTHLSFTDPSASYECSVCGKGVHLNPNPLPNGIDIGGEAVALHCK